MSFDLLPGHQLNPRQRCCCGYSFIILGDNNTRAIIWGSLRWYVRFIQIEICKFQLLMADFILLLAAFNSSKYLTVRWWWEDLLPCRLSLCDVPTPQHCHRPTIPFSMMIWFRGNIIDTMSAVPKKTTTKPIWRGNSYLDEIKLKLSRNGMWANQENVKSLLCIFFKLTDLTTKYPNYYFYVNFLYIYSQIVTRRC